MLLLKWMISLRDQIQSNPKVIVVFEHKYEIEISVIA